MTLQIKTALLSVSDKTNLLDFAQFLHGRGVKLIATGGTCQSLRQAGLDVKEVSDVTGFPEIMRGRVKTLHPKIHAGLLAERQRPEDMDALKQIGADTIDLVVINLYPFEKVAGGSWNPDEKAFAETVENIDVGGPAMLRAASKNFEHVVVVTGPEQYNVVRNEIEASGTVSRTLRRSLALEAFRRTAAYDAAITVWLEAVSQEPATRTVPVSGPTDSMFPPFFVRRYDKVYDLKYGENPHQKASFYREMGPPTLSVATAKVLRGEALSYNNILDCDAALHLVGEFSAPACAVIKHTNPCGVAEADDILNAFQMAREADPTSAFGGILGFNRVIDEDLAKAITSKGNFFECIVAPNITTPALDYFDRGSAWISRVRLLMVGDQGGKLNPNRPRQAFVVRGVEGGWLVQSPDTTLFDPTAEEPWRVVTKATPSDDLMRDMRTAYAVVKHVKSNAIVLVKNSVAVGIGAGQMSRVEAVELAVKRAGAEKAKGTVMASDAFFPFPDGAEMGIKAGVQAIIQPGGSKKDEEVIALCNKHNIPMVFTGVRHFRH